MSPPVARPHRSLRYPDSPHLAARSTWRASVTRELLDSRTSSAYVLYSRTSHRRCAKASAGHRSPVGGAPAYQKTASAFGRRRRCCTAWTRGQRCQPSVSAALLVMHQMGSHGPAYWRRSPPDGKPFQPECETNAASSAGPAALVNAYDNSIAYTDRVLAGAIGWLEAAARHVRAADAVRPTTASRWRERAVPARPALRGGAARADASVPWWSGRPRGMALRLAAQRDAPLSHDHLFHTVAGALGIRASRIPRRARPVRGLLRP